MRVGKNALANFKKRLSQPHSMPDNAARTAPDLTPLPEFPAENNQISDFSGTNKYFYGALQPKQGLRQGGQLARYQPPTRTPVDASKLLSGAKNLTSPPANNPINDFSGLNPGGMPNVQNMNPMQDPQAGAVADAAGQVGSALAHTGVDAAVNRNIDLGKQGSASYGTPNINQDLPLDDYAKQVMNRQGREYKGGSLPYNDIGSPIGLTVQDMAQANKNIAEGRTGKGSFTVLPSEGFKQFGLTSPDQARQEAMARIKNPESQVSGGVDFASNNRDADIKALGRANMTPEQRAVADKKDMVSQLEEQANDYGAGLNQSLGSMQQYKQQRMAANKKLNKIAASEKAGLDQANKTADRKIKKAQVLANIAKLSRPQYKEYQTGFDKNSGLPTKGVFRTDTKTLTPVKIPSQLDTELQSMPSDQADAYRTLAGQPPESREELATKINQYRKSVGLPEMQFNLDLIS